MKDTYGNKANIRYLPYNKISNIIYTGKYNLLLNILNAHPYKECFVLLPNRYEISQSVGEENKTFFIRGWESPLAHNFLKILRGSPTRKP